MKEKLLIILAILLIPVMLESCCGKTFRYSVMPGELRLQVFNTTDFNIPDVAEIESDNVAIHFDFPDAVIETMAYHNPFSFGNTAYATSCNDEIIYVPDVKSVSITADHDFDENYPAGSELSGLFKGVRYYYSGDEDGQVSGNTASEYTNLQDAVTDYFMLLNYQRQYNPDNAQHPFIVFKPSKRNSATGTFIFTVRVTFTNDAVATAATIPLTLH